MLISVRALNNAVRDRLEAQIKHLIHAQADAFGATAEVHYSADYPLLVNDPAMTEFATQVANGSFQASVQGDIGLLQKDQGKDFAFAGEPITDKSIIGNGVAIGIRKNDTALRDKINAAIVALRQSGEYDRIAKKYFAYDVYGE